MKWKTYALCPPPLPGPESGIGPTSSSSSSRFTSGAFSTHILSSSSSPASAIASGRTSFAFASSRSSLRSRLREDDDLCSREDEWWRDDEERWRSLSLSGSPSLSRARSLSRRRRRRRSSSESSESDEMEGERRRREEEDLCLEREEDLWREGELALEQDKDGSVTTQRERQWQHCHSWKERSDSLPLRFGRRRPDVHVGLITLLATAAKQTG